MAKKKSVQSANDGGQGPPAGDLSGKMEQLTVSRANKSLFPAMPKRAANVKHPGNPVILISNLFKISVIQNKPIFRYAVEIDFVKVDKEKKGQSGDAGGGTVPRKIRGDLARQIIEQTLLMYVKEKKLPVTNGYNYCYDLLGKNLFTLFDMFQNEKGVSKKELIVPVKLPTIKDNKKVEMVPQDFKVIIHKGTKLNIKELFDFCAGTGARDTRELKEHQRLINTIIRAEIVKIPRNLCTATSTFDFGDRNKACQISAGVQLNRGYYTSAKLTGSGVVLNVHNAFGAFCEPSNLVDLLRQTRTTEDELNRGLRDITREKLLREVQNKQVEATHINYGTRENPHYRKYRVNDISGSSMDTFMLIDRSTNVPKEITIAKYFEIEYKTKLKFPKLPCVIDRGRKIPLELCRLVEKQRVMRKMTPDETAKIIRQAALPPEQTFGHIRDSVNEIKARSKPLQDFGLEFEPKPIMVEGYELPPIALLGGNRRDLMPKNGEYPAQNEKFVRPAVVKKWALAFIVDKNRDRDLNADIERNGLETDKFAKLFKSAGEQKGAMVQLNPFQSQGRQYSNEFQILYVDQREVEFKNTLTRYLKHCNKNKFDHIIFVLSYFCPDYVYRYLQFLEATAQEGRGPTEKWTRVSCIKYDNYKKKIIQDRFNGSMFLSNLWLKYNTKLGGINYVLKTDARYAFLQPGYIFIAIDVCHPAPGDKLIQSVAAAVGMWDVTNPKLSYCTKLRVQKKTSENGSSTREDVVDIGPMVEGILDSYKQVKNDLPKSIVILRDGVSEGQFQIVLESELSKVKSSLLKVYGQKGQPKVSCLVVQKRHKVRFMRRDPVQTRKGPDFNMQPGTVVDSVVVHPTDFSFYLAPHKTIQGTTRPAHIYMILDEIKFSQDEAQAMIHALSYLSPRCNKSTSIPTPINLADRAAERGKNIVISWNDQNRAKLDDNTRLERLNKLFDNLADKSYLNTLFYI